MNPDLDDEIDDEMDPVEVLLERLREEVDSALDHVTKALPGFVPFDETDLLMIEDMTAFFRRFNRRQPVDPRFQRAVDEFLAKLGRAPGDGAGPPGQPGGPERPGLPGLPGLPGRRQPPG
jgi:hypothetical protein